MKVDRDGLKPTPIKDNNLWWKQEREFRWSVPDGRRDEMGKPIHDDLMVRAMLCARLEAQSWARGESQVIEIEDPVGGMRSVY